MKRGDKKPEGFSWQALKAKWGAWFSSKAPVLRFGAMFGVLMALFYGLLTAPICDRYLYFYLEGNAWVANAILNILGQHAHVSEVTISSPKFAMAIRRGCDAVEPTWLFCAAVLAYPVPFRRKLWVMLICVILLQVLNLARIVSLYFIGVYLPSFFNTAHVELWPTVFILVVILLMVGWIEWTKREP